MAFSFQEIQMIALAVIAVAAVLYDLYSGRIPNAVIVTGLAFGFFWQIFVNGPIGIILFLGGTGLPLLLLGLLYYYRMIGAGDIKLLCVAGGFLGPERGLLCMACAILTGAVFSAIIMLRRHSLFPRLFFFLDYVRDCAEGKAWKPYMDDVDKEAKFCFSVPVLIGILCCICKR